MTSLEEYLAYIFSYKYLIYSVLFSAFLGVQIFSKVPHILITSMLSSSTTLHGIILIGGITVVGNSTKEEDVLFMILGFLAILMGTINIVGGLLLTDRLLVRYKKKKSTKN
ncbi:MAG: NAD(P) transhydrogenase subunit alpha [Leptospiraceae bacterium]|nr:NAD(P) transhydrogenase subunit alpha [Leptospiraceae bacterium]MCP5510452.1 NAD(P) transhydrogenase subunit alpha [Leptospiraceae bacterium]